MYALLLLKPVYIAPLPPKSFFMLGLLILPLALGSQVRFMWQLASKKQMPMGQKEAHLRLVW